MKENLTELVFIIDESGSMYPLKDDTIGGFNTMIDEQKKQNNECHVTIYLFGSYPTLLHDNVPLEEIEYLNENTYAPRGTTALLDTIGKAIDSVGMRLAETPEEERPSKVMFTIITDGEENASRKYTWDKVKEMVTHQKTKYSWIFSFIGADIDSFAVGGNLGIDAALTKNYTKSKLGTTSVYRSMSTAYTTLRSADTKDISVTLDMVAQDMNNIV